MNNSNHILKNLPFMKSGEELISSLTVLPEYNEDIRKENESIRLIALSDLYKIYLPSNMSAEIYSKLYLALLRSLQKKETKLSVKQQVQNYYAIRQKENNGILGGSDSFTIIGTSGIGKSSAIHMAINLITGNHIIELEEPYVKIIPCIIVQCPFDSSVKGLLLEILRKVDESIGSKYYQNAIKSRATTDMLIGSVSQVALNHIGLLVVDEIQHVVNAKNGKSLVGMLTQLINNSGISICMVGTPECTVFFEQAMQLARRSLGLQYTKMDYDQYFIDFCTILFSYQYVKNKTEINEAIIQWLYEHSAGMISIVVSLIHDAQEIAILNKGETLDIISLNEAYKQRLIMLHGYIEPSSKKKTSAIKKKEIELPSENIMEIKEEFITDFSIQNLITVSKTNHIDIVELLKQYITVEEVSIC
ncbi:MAG: ATP-binding protein [Clostridia bacterium]|nr:ATP-binding protein [Clostridia bacterium]